MFPIYLIGNYMIAIPKKHGSSATIHSDDFFNESQRNQGVIITKWLGINTVK